LNDQEIRPTRLLFKDGTSDPRGSFSNGMALKATKIDDVNNQQSSSHCHICSVTVAFAYLYLQILLVVD
jgi:hypothetical protein